MAELFRQTSPLATVLSDIQNGIQHQSIGYFDVTSLNRKEFLNNFNVMR